MRKLLNIIWFFFFLGSSLATASSPVDPSVRLKPFEASFEVSRNGIVLGTLEFSFKLTASGEYEYTGYTKASRFLRWFVSDVVHETSKGRYENNQINPVFYEYKQTDRKLKKHTLLEFDWDNQVVWTEAEGTRWSQPVQPKLHDKLSQQQALRIDLSNGANNISYPVADGGMIKTYHYQIAGTETINIPYGRVESIKVRRRKEDKAPDFTIWVAPDLEYMPVKIERKRSSGRYRMELLKLKMGQSSL